MSQREAFLDTASEGFDSTREIRGKNRTEKYSWEVEI